MYAFEMSLADHGFDKAIAASTKHKAPDAAERAFDLYRTQQARFVSTCPAQADAAAARLAYALDLIHTDDESPLSAMVGLIEGARRLVLSKDPVPYLAKRLSAICEIAHDYEGDPFTVAILESVAKGYTRPRLAA